MSGQTTPPSLLTGVDWQAIAYALGMATVMSVLMTLRARNQARTAGLPLPRWDAVLLDTLLGGFIGAIASVVLPRWFMELRSFEGTTLVAGLGGILGPKAADWVSANGLSTALDWVGSGAGKLAQAIGKRHKEVGGADTKDGEGDGRA